MLHRVSMVLLLLVACAADEEVTASHAALLTPGDPLLVEPGTLVRIQPAHGPAPSCLVTGDWQSHTSGGWQLQYNVTQRSTCGTSANGHYWLHRLENGHYVFQNHGTGRCLDVLEWNLDDGAHVIEWSCHFGENQQWRPVHLDANGTFRLMSVHSGKCLDLGGPGDGYRVQQKSCSDGPGQRFRVTAPPQLRITLEQPAVSVPKCLAVQDGAMQDGAAVVQWDCTGDASQRFLVTHFDSGYEIRFVHSNLCLTVAGAGDTNGTPVVQATCTGVAEQRFSPDSPGPWPMLEPGHVSKCVDRDQMFNDANGARIQLWACHGEGNQHFRFDHDLTP